MAEERAPKVEHPSVEERIARGKTARARWPRSSHAELPAQGARKDPVAILQAQAQSRVPELVPIRHGRMSAGPFAFYRGGAAIMAADLAMTPTTNLRTQLCGDMHLSNFGVFGAPDRRLVFDINDFDETLPGPFEWDVKRMAASFTIGAQQVGLSDKQARAITLASVAAYRASLAGFAGMSNLDVWYSRISEDDIRAYAQAVATQRAARNTDRMLAKAKTKTSFTAARKLTELVDGRRQFIEQPPLISREAITDDRRALMHDRLREYRRTLTNDRKRLLERYEFIDIAMKVVGVGSVGTRAVVMLLQGRDAEDLLVLQIKEAQRSVLEEYLPNSSFRHSGQRVVEGQRFMQAAGDIFLGWVSGVDAIQYYVRQLHDMKGGIDITMARPEGVLAYAKLCGYTLARAHARGGDALSISSYLGSGDTFDRAILEFSLKYAAHNQHDFDQMVAAIDAGVLEAQSGV